MLAPTTFSALLDRLCDAAPADGYQTARQLGQLTPAELGAVLKKESTVLADAARGDALVRAVVQALHEPDDLTRSVCIGADILGALQAQARVYLLPLVQAELQCRAERAYERQLEAFYGSASPQSDRERLMSARGLREKEFH